MHKTKMIKVYFPGWQLWIFSLTVNLLVLAIQPRLTFAQANADQANNLQTSNKNKTTDLEPKILSEINRVRTSPQAYAQWLETQRQYYDGIWLRLPGEKPVRTNKGRKALEEAIAFLKLQQPLPALKTSEQTATTATSELENFANANNIQYFSYGRKTATGIVMDLVVDELFPDRRRRQSLLSPKAEETGVVCKPDPRYAKVCAIAYSDSSNSNSANVTDVAIAPPETATKPESQVTEEAKAATSIPTPQAEVESQETNTEVAEEETATEETVATATLPVPPQPQVPPSPTLTTETEVKPTDEEEIVADNPEEEEEIVAENPEEEEEIVAENPEEEEEEEIVAENPEEEEEIVADNPEKEKAEVIESEIATIVEENQVEETTKDEEVANSDQELEAEESLEDEPQQVAINTENTDFGEKVEQGKLEEGDRVIADDGSLYDFYPIQGKAGDSFTIYLESDEFDAFVALVDSNGKTIDENDDISQEDSNSKISVTLPEDGVYNVIVNTYDENGTGEYILTVSR